MQVAVMSCLRIGLAFAVLVTATALGRADEPEPAIKKTFEGMLNAIKANDRDAFVAEGTEAVKKGTTAEIMDALNKLVGPRLNKGYQSTYLCQLKQAGHQIHLWKLAFKDDGDDIVVRMALKDGKVAGFFFQ